MRGATGDINIGRGGNIISIHAPHEGSDRVECIVKLEISISIHAPHEGSDGSGFSSGINSYVFQSTLPMRGATEQHFQRLILPLISIHAPHEGSDSKTVQKTDACFVINRNFAKLNSQGSTWLAC